MNNTTELKIPLSELTQSGISAFRSLIGISPGLDRSTVEQRVLEIAGGSNSASIIDARIHVPLFPELKTRHDTALLVTDLLTAGGIEAGPSSRHEGLFSWLALVFLPSLCKRDGKKLETGETYRYILSRSTTDFYRHLVACPYWLMRQYGRYARIFLAQDARIMPDVVEQIVSRPALIDSEGVVQLIDRFYWDHSKDAPKRGYTTTKRLDEPPPGYPKSLPAPGTLRALESTLGQLQCTYDLRSMNADQIFEKLPSEFEPWANNNER